jgi:hypothetical protein
LRAFSTFASERTPDKRYLYVAVPGIRDYLEFGGHGLLVFDIDNNHKFVKRIPTKGVDENGKPLNVKGVCASAATKRLHISTIKTLQCVDLLTEKVLWEKAYEGGCDRMALSPDGKIIYLPSLEKDHWHVVDALTGDVIKKLVPRSGAHNTLYGPDGKFVYLAGLKSPLLSISDTSDHSITRAVGPFEIRSARSPSTANKPSVSSTSTSCSASRWATLSQERSFTASKSRVLARVW